jgi:hypothetical protein
MTEKEIADAIDGHQLRNHSLSNLLSSKGVNIREPRLIECHFWSKSESDANGIAAALRSRGFSILTIRKAELSQPDLDWNVEASIRQSVDITTRPEFTGDIVRLAIGHNSRYDGWGTAV